ncbi:MAG: hypothetical protein P4L40_25025 [Terracidiphilus sp.]|nr:hypothetical protein [Terracidiphilus sp.]
MALSNRERQTLYRRRARAAKATSGTLVSVVEEAIAMTEQAIALEREQGTRPGDGTAAGEFMAKQERWIEFQRRHLANAIREARSWYDPTVTG